MGLPVQASDLSLSAVDPSPPLLLTLHTHLCLLPALLWPLPHPALLPSPVPTCSPVALPLSPPSQLIAAFLAQCPAAQVEEMRFPCEPKEYFAARCLRARKYSLVEALKLVEVTTTWRREINIKGLQAREAPEILGCLEDELQFFYQKSYFACRDNEGRPVYVERGGTVDVDAMFSECCSRRVRPLSGQLASPSPATHTPHTFLRAPVHTDIEKLIDYHTWQNEVQMVPLYDSASKAAGKPITTLCAIVDMGGMSSKISTSSAWVRTGPAPAHPLHCQRPLTPHSHSHPLTPPTPSAATRKYVTTMIGIDSKHYPETLGRMFLINAPLIFSAAWMLIQPFLDERTQKKIEIISSESAWKKRLRECIDPAQLPAEYGGDAKVPVFPGSRTRKTTVAAGKRFHAASEAVAAGASVRFRWFCRPGDIGFALHFVAGARPADGTAPPPPAAWQCTAQSPTPAARRPWWTSRAQRPRLGTLWPLGTTRRGGGAGMCFTGLMSWWGASPSQWGG